MLTAEFVVKIAPGTRRKGEKKKSDILVGQRIQSTLCLFLRAYYERGSNCFYKQTVCGRQGGVVN